jgi:hypothetical protein
VADEDLSSEELANLATDFGEVRCCIVSSADGVRVYLQQDLPTMFEVSDRDARTSRVVVLDSFVWNVD